MVTILALAAALAQGPAAPAAPAPPSLPSRRPRRHDCSSSVTTGDWKSYVAVQPEVIAKWAGKNALPFFSQPLSFDQEERILDTRCD